MAEIPSTQAPKPEDQWTCRECLKTFVVPSLARLCEAKHREQDKRAVSL